MLLSALRRAVAAIVGRPLDSLAGNLAGFGIFGGGAAALLILAQGTWWALVGAALLLWFGAAWFCGMARKLLDGQSVGLAWTLGWLRQRALLLTLDLLVLLALLAWSTLALQFWKANRLSLPPLLAWGALGLVGAVILWLGLALLLLPPLSSEPDATFTKDLRRAALLALAFFPQLLLAASWLALGSGLLGLLVGSGHWLSRVLGLPLAMAPMLTPIALALFWVALLDEMKAHSLGRPSPGQGAPSAVSLAFPWR